MNDDYSQLLRDIRAKVATTAGKYPEFTEVCIKNGHWHVLVINIGWMKTTDYLNHCDQSGLL